MPILLLLSVVAFAADRTYPVLDLAPRNMPPILDNGYLIVRNQELEIYGPDGALAYRIGKLPDTKLLVNAATDRDGTTAVATEMNNNNGAIAVFRRDGTRITMFDTHDFVPSYLAFGADHSVWAAARGQLRHFSLEGRQLGVYGRYSTNEKWQEPIVHLPALRVSGERIGYLMYEDPHVNMEWVEFDLGGKELGRWTVPTDLRAPPIFVGAATFLPTANAVMALDGASGEWKATSIYADGSLAGADKNFLVFAERHGNTLHWIDVGGR